MNKVILLIIVILLVGLMIGFAVGTYVTIKAVASIAGGFVDEQLVRSAIYQYKNNIGNCYPSIFENASIHSD